MASFPLLDYRSNLPTVDAPWSANQIRAPICFSSLIGVLSPITASFLISSKRIFISLEPYWSVMKLVNRQVDVVCSS